MTFPFPSKTSLVAALCVMVPAAAFAQSGSGSSPSNATVKSTPTVTAKKPVVKKSSAEIRRSALKAVEEVTPIDEDLNITLSAEDIELAKRVYVGSIPCELGAARPACVANCHGGMGVGGPRNVPRTPSRCPGVAARR